MINPDKENEYMFVDKGGTMRRFCFTFKASSLAEAREAVKKFGCNLKDGFLGLRISEDET